MRFKILKLAQIVLGTTTTLQGIWKMKGFEKIRKHSRNELVLKEIEYSEFIAVIEEVRMKIIVKQIENGQRIFWSIIPYWGMNKSTNTRKLHSGYPEED